VHSFRHIQVFGKAIQAVINGLYVKEALAVKVIGIGHGWVGAHDIGVNQYDANQSGNNEKHSKHGLLIR